MKLCVKRGSDVSKVTCKQFIHPLQLRQNYCIYCLRRFGFYAIIKESFMEHLCLVSTIYKIYKYVSMQIIHYKRKTYNKMYNQQFFSTPSVV
jgi:hypothetical protein